MKRIPFVVGLSVIALTLCGGSVLAGEKVTEVKLGSVLSLSGGAAKVTPCLLPVNAALPLDVIEPFRVPFWMVVLFVAAPPITTEPVPLEKVAGKRKCVAPDHTWVQTARHVGTCLGD